MGLDVANLIIFISNNGENFFIFSFKKKMNLGTKKKKNDFHGQNMPYHVL
jgi:hypothetical protein